MQQPIVRSRGSAVYRQIISGVTTRLALLFQLTWISILRWFNANCSHVNTLWLDFWIVFYRIKEHLKRSDEEESRDVTFDNKTFLRSRRNSLTSVVTRLASSQPSLGTELKNKLEVQFMNNKYANPPDIVISPCNEENSEKDQSSSVDQESITTGSEDYNQKVLKIVSEMHVARPDQLRFYLRDVMMFLLDANACLWLFMSLSGTAFSVYQYESEFFGSSAWTTITMICRPLGIFFRMHSAGCLFEMWSFA